MLTSADIIPLHLTTVTYPSWHPLSGQRGIVNAYALRHADGIILIDSGVGEGNAFIDAHYQPEHTPLPEVLGGHGHAPRDIVAVVNTHLHFDHCGHNLLFPGVPIYVQVEEYEAAHQPNATILEWVDFPGAAYRQVQGEVEIAAGIRLIPTPGHSAGHQSVQVMTAEGVALIAGQAVQASADWIALQETGGLPPGNAPVDEAAYQESARRLLRAEPARVYFSHDHIIWGR